MGDLFLCLVLIMLIWAHVIEKKDNFSYLILTIILSNTYQIIKS